jgi:DNA-binding transcriptional LysR family regulator
MLTVSAVAGSEMPLGVPRIEFRDLEWFLVLIDEGHLGRAAELLGITPEELFDGMRRVEAGVGVALFAHQSPGVAPTTAARSFAEPVRPLLAGLELAATEARRVAGALPPVRIGCVPDLPLGRLQGFLGAVYSERPELELDVVYLRTSEQIRRVRSGALDLGLIHHVGDIEGIELESVFPGAPLVAFLPLGHRLAHADAVRAGDILEGAYALVVPPREADPALADRIVAVLSKAGHDVGDVRESIGDDPRSLLLAVAQRQWVALEPASILDAVGDLASLVTLRPLDPPVRMPDTALAWRASPPPELQAIVSLARDAASSLRAD